MANQLDLYIMESKKHEQSGNVEMELYAELQKISASSNTEQQITEKEIKSGADELNRAISNAAEKATEIVQKTTYSACTESVLKLLQNNNISEVYLAGIDTDCCVLATAIELFDCNIRPIVLAQYCASNGGKRSHNAALTVLERTIGKAQISLEPYSV